MKIKVYAGENFSYFVKVGSTLKFKVQGDCNIVSIEIARVV